MEAQGEQVRSGAAQALAEQLRPWDEALADPARAQDAVLGRVLGHLAQTGYGVDHGAPALAEAGAAHAAEDASAAEAEARRGGETSELVAAFRRAFPVMTYDDYTYRSSPPSAPPPLRRRSTRSGAEPPAPIGMHASSWPSRSAGTRTSLSSAGSARPPWSSAATSRSATGSIPSSGGRQIMTLGSTPGINTRHAATLTAMYGGDVRSATRRAPRLGAQLRPVLLRGAHPRPGESGSLVVTTPILARYRIGDVIQAVRPPYFRCIGRENNWWTSWDYWWREVSSLNLGRL